MPPVFCEESYDGLAFSRLPWDFAEGDTPLFDEIMSRCSDSSAAMAFMGSLFVQDSDRQQYLFLHGDGMNGKSTLIRMLGRIFNNSYIAVEPPTANDKFWNWQLIGKRLVAFPDCNDEKWIGSSKFKMLTGGDSVSCQEKGKNAASHLLNCKFIFCSNTKPDISGKMSDLRRVIFCEMSPIGVEPEIEYEEKLWLEAPYIVHKCIQQYMKQNKGGFIVTDASKVNEIVQQNEEKFSYIFEKHFELDVYQNVLEYEKKRFSCYDLVAIMKSEHMLGEKRAFTDWLKRVHGIEYKQIRLGSDRKWFYVGAKTRIHWM